mmetsp:Transcript_5801/g.17737  ORF Transcript_5801/g.17737 Transcript_5801/m.17737 type:complete len:318 (-) Transcript_5801:1272-2225(-)
MKVRTHDSRSVGTSSLQLWRLYSSAGSMYLSMCLRSASTSTASLLVPSQLVTIGHQPRSSVLKKIIPARDTVAGEACDKSSTSNSRDTCGGIAMRSPDSRVSSLLSSSVVFIDSIHSVSTGPSNRIHFWSGDSSLHTVRIMRASTPSCHSCVAESKQPYSSSLDSASGLMVCTCTFWYCSLSGSSFLSLAMARVRHFHASDLPAPVLPTIMLPWRATLQSKTWMILTMYSSTTCRLFSVSSASIAARSEPPSLTGSSTPGKRSESSAMKSGRSRKTSLGLMRSSMVRYRMTSSGASGSTRLRLPAARAIGMTNERSP